MVAQRPEQHRQRSAVTDPGVQAAIADLADKWDDHDQEHGAGSSPASDPDVRDALDELVDEWDRAENGE